MYTSITTPTSAPFTNTSTSSNPLRSKESAMHSLLTAPRDTRPSQAPSFIEPKEPDSPPGFESFDEPLEAPPSLKTPVARCADGHGTMVGLFFSDNIIDIARAKAMCGLCPLQASCLSDALEREEPWGVWGGELLSGGRIIANKRACGRPPTRPRPEMVIDEMGPVGVVA
jgi:Transcription factor WhiB